MILYVANFPLGFPENVSVESRQAPLIIYFCHRDLSILNAILISFYKEVWKNFEILSGSNEWFPLLLKQSKKSLSQTESFTNIN